MTAQSNRAADLERRSRSPHVVVVGGGISGLAAAHAVLVARPDVRVTLLEAGPATGGKLRRGEVAGQPVDLGAESILNRRPEAVDLAKRVGLAASVVYPATTAAGIWSRDAVHPLPRTVMGVPSDLTSVRASGVLSRRAVARLGLEPRLRRLHLDEDVAVGRLVARRLGAEVRDRLVEPLLGGVYAGRADELSFFATAAQLVPAVREHGGLLAAAASLGDRGAAASEPVFAGIDGGVGRLAEATEQAIRAAGGRVSLLTTVRELTRRPEGFQLVCGPTVAPEVVDADAVVIATPALAAARLVREVAPSAGTDLSGVEAASMAIVTLAWPRAAIPAGLRGSGFLVPPVDERTIKGATYSSAKWGWLDPSLLVVRCSVGRYGEVASLQVDDANLVRSAVRDLQAAIGISDQPIDALVTRWGGALPQYTVGHLDRVQRVLDAVAEVPGLAVCGATYEGVGIAACVASGGRAATQVVAQLPAARTMPS